MRGSRALGCIAVLVCVTEASTARADEPLSAIEVGVRAGIALPIGSVDTATPVAQASVSDPLAETVASTIPVWLDFGFRLAWRWSLGAFASLAPGREGGALKSVCQCSPLDARAGAELHYHLWPDRTWDPWFGAGFGYEWLIVGNAGVGDGGQDTSLRASGWEFANVQAGADYRLTPEVHIGPFAALTVAEYTTKSTGTSSDTFQQTALHGWFVLGVRGVFDFWREGRP